MNVFLSRQSLRANYLQVLNGGKLQSIWMWKNFAFPIPCATFFFLSVAERMHLASFFFLMFSSSSYPHPPPSFTKTPILTKKLPSLEDLGFSRRLHGRLSRGEHCPQHHQMGQHTSQEERKSRHIHEIQTCGENMEGKVRKTARDFLWRSEVKVYLHA